MPITYSAGIILHRVRENTIDIEFFVCTPGGPEWFNKELWNFPKGTIENDENPVDTAIREFTEETNIDLIDIDDIVPEGFIKQNPYKSVYVFSKEYKGEDLTDCHSNMFTWVDGEDYPEIGKYDWKTLDELKAAKGIKAYYPVYETIKKRYVNNNYILS